MKYNSIPPNTYKLSAIYKNKLYPLTFWNRSSLEEAIKTIKCILPGCTDIKEYI